MILSLESFGSKKRVVRGCFESRYWRYLRLPLFLGHEEFVAALVDKTVVFEKYLYCLPRTLSSAFRISRLHRSCPCELLNSDNTNTVAWLNKGRCSKKKKFAACVFYKYVCGLKVKALYKIFAQHVGWCSLAGACCVG